MPLIGNKRIEPVTNVNAGLNAAARGIVNTGVRILAPSQKLKLDVVIAVEMCEPTEVTIV
jgi:hypothetical protein